MKLYTEPVIVRDDDNGRIQSLTWRRQFYRVRSIEEVWLWRGKWWITPDLRGLRRAYVRVACINSGGVVVNLELYRELGKWQLSRVLD